MQDVMHILQVLRDHAQTDLAFLNKRRAEFLDEILKINHARTSAREYTPSLLDYGILEKWHQAQSHRVKILEEQLKCLQTEIDVAKSRYKLALAKYMSVEQAVSRLAYQQQVLDEDKNTEAQMEIFRLANRR